MSGTIIRVVDLGFDPSDLAQPRPRKSMLTLTIELGENAPDGAPDAKLAAPVAESGAAYKYLMGVIPQHVKARLEILVEGGYSVDGVLAELWEAIREATDML